jgi:hypothetical protein
MTTRATIKASDLPATSYTAEGSVRGSCGHNHRTIKAAFDCCAKDQRAVKRGNPGGGSYSDRDVARSDGKPMTEDEIREWQRINDSRP